MNLTELKTSHRCSTEMAEINIDPEFVEGTADTVTPILFNIAT